jgi:hypothetical protein
MKLNDTTLDRRGSFRCPAVDAEHRAVLKIGDLRMGVRIVDESAGGFGIETDVLPNLNVGDVCQLLTEAGWYEVQLKYVSLVEDALNTVGGVDAYRLGFSRGKYIFDYPEETTHEPLRLRIQNYLFSMRPFGGSMTYSGLTFAIIVVLGIIGLAMLVTRQQGQAVDLSRSDLKNAQSKSKESSDAAWPIESHIDHLAKPEHGSSELPTGRSDFHSAVAELPKIISLKSNKKPPAVESKTPGAFDRIKNVSGAAALIVPEVAKILQLTQDQLAEIQSIVEQTTKAIQNLDILWPDAERQEQSQRREEIMERSRQQAVDTLTDSQRLQWLQLLQNEDAEGTKK